MSNYKKTARVLFYIAFIELIIIVGMICGFAVCLMNEAQAAEIETVDVIAEIKKDMEEVAASMPVCEPHIEPERVNPVPPTPIYTEVKTAPLGEEIPLSWELQQAVVDNCEEYGLDPKIILGIMDVESDFRLTCDNGICYGIMQIHKGNKNWVKKNAGVTDIYDPAQNIRAGCWILSKGLELYGDMEQALVWYNTGAVKTNSSNYSRQVLRDAEKWGALITNA